MLAITIVFGCIFLATFAEIIEYNNYYIFPDSPEYRVIPKFDKTEVPHWSPGKGRSYIDLSSLRVQSACYEDPDAPSPPEFDPSSCKKTFFDLLMFEAPNDRHWRDYWPDDNYCCTQDLIDEDMYGLFMSLLVWFCRKLILCDIF